MKKPFFLIKIGVSKFPKYIPSFWKIEILFFVRGIFSAVTFFCIVFVIFEIGMRRFVHIRSKLLICDFILFFASVYMVNKVPKTLSKYHFNMFKGTFVGFSLKK